MTWQAELLASLARDLPRARIEPYGSAAGGSAVDGWSDLDVVIATADAVDLERVLRGEIWAFQSTVAAEAHVVRAVLVDGRRADVTLRGALGVLPSAPPDNEVRVDAALAASKLGRGSDLIGLHLCLGIVRRALVLRMEGRDRDTERSHHRESTPHDRDARRLLDVLAAPVGPSTALRAYEAYADSRALVEPGFVADPRGAAAVVRRGLAGT